MVQVSAVVTTGIYCRPGCAAKPRADNVRSFPLAAAAEAAGYRACLRCRPYRTPQSFPWTGSELVCRAVQLVLQGSLDDATEAQLGRRLGISARHLRRLFATHLGVTPDCLARSARVHFARRLLDDTDLTITEVAFAAGFGSLRQFNRACQDVFRAPPRVLRAKRRKSDRLIADGGLTLRLPFPGGLDWMATASYLAARATPGVELVSNGIYRRTITIGGEPGVIELRAGGEDFLLLGVHLPHWEELTHLVGRARRIANIDFDGDEPRRHLGNDPVIGPSLRARPGLRPPGTFDPFETGVRAIVGERMTISSANIVMGRMVQRLGTPVPGLGGFGLTHTFPAPAVVAVADLDGLGLAADTGGAIRAFANAVVEETVRLDGSVGLDRLIASVSELEGLGPVTAQYLALRIGEPDAFPLQEPGPGPRFTLDACRSDAELAALAETWRPWRALAVAHLWMASERSEAAILSANGE